jgi:hypothetical protein
MTQTKRIFCLCLLVALAGLASAAQAKVKPEIMGISLEMGREAAQARLKALGQLEKEDRKRQEVWAIKDRRISHLLVGYDGENRVRYVTAIARTDGPRIRYQEIAELKSAQRSNYQGNYRFTWEIPERRGQFAFVVIAHGRDPHFLDSYSIKKLVDEEVD